MKLSEASSMCNVSLKFCQIVGYHTGILISKGNYSSMGENNLFFKIKIMNFVRNRSLSV